MSDYQDCPEYLRDFLFYMLTIRGRSPRTVQAYYIDLRTFLRYIKCVKILGKSASDLEYIQSLEILDLPLEVVAQISLSDVYQFLNYTMTLRENTGKTRSRKVSSLRSFFQYLTIKTNLLKENPVENLEIPAFKKSLPRYLDLEESLSLLTSMDTADPYYARDFCILTLFLNCGMRLSELVGINLYDIREDTLKLVGKGNKERMIYLNDACRAALDAYLAQRKPTTNAVHKDALFLTSRGTRISARRVQQIVEDCLKRAGLSGQGYSPHKLRHTAATLMYQHGDTDIRVLKEMLGHVSLSTTEIYTHVSNKQMAAAAKKAPLASVMPRKRAKVPKVTDYTESEDE